MRKAFLSVNAGHLRYDRMPINHRDGEQILCTNIRLLVDVPDGAEFRTDEGLAMATIIDSQGRQHVVSSYYLEPIADPPAVA